MVFEIEPTALLASFEELRGHPFDFAISNPPFGRSREILLPGVTVDLNVLAVASELARCGAFILPQESCSFKYSGQQGHEYARPNNFHKFNLMTGIQLTCSSVDCAMYREDWRGVNPNVEIALWDLDEQEDKEGKKIEIEVGKWRRSERVERVERVERQAQDRVEMMDVPAVDPFD